MSMNLSCTLVRGDTHTSSDVALEQTDTSTTYRILNSGLDWRGTARLYLEWVAERHSPRPGAMREIAGKKARREQRLQHRAAMAAPLDPCVKWARKQIGDAWRIADETGGRLVFGLS